MGEGYSYKCSCGYEKHFSVGGGFRYWCIQEELNEAIKAGEYGDALKRILEENPKGVFSGEMRIYLCPRCDNLQQDYSLGFYEHFPDLDKLQEDKEEFTYWMSYDCGWRQTRRIVHKCERCGGRMKHIVNMDGLRCPQCHSVLPDPKFFLLD